MYVGAVVKLAVIGKAFDVRHAGCQIAGRYVINPEGLKAGGIHQCRSLEFIHPVPGGGRGGVFAAVQGFGDDVGGGIGLRHQAVDQSAFTGAGRAEYQCDAALQRFGRI